MSLLQQKKQMNLIGWTEKLALYIDSDGAFKEAPDL